MGKRAKKSLQAQVLREVTAERSYQDSKWGTEFDDKNTVSDWVTYIAQYAGKAAEMGLDADEQREFFIQAAAIAVAAVETCDRNGGFPSRHFEVEEQDD